MRASCYNGKGSVRGELYVGMIDLGGSGSKTMIHALNTSSGAEDWYASVVWNVGTVGVAA